MSPLEMKVQGSHRGQPCVPFRPAVQGNMTRGTRILSVLFVQVLWDPLLLLYLSQVAGSDLPYEALLICPQFSPLSGTGLFHDH